MREQDGSGELVRALGLWDSVSLILGIMIGSGIFLMAGAIALQLDSLPAVLAVWAFGGLLSLAGAVALSEPPTGRPRAFTALHWVRAFRNWASSPPSKRTTQRR